MTFTKCLASLLVLTIWAIQALSRPLNEQYVLKIHQDWMAQHGRVYKDAQEKETRFNIFKNNLEYIENFNKGVVRGYKLGVNQFADLTNDEFRSLYTGYKFQTSEIDESTVFEYGNLTSVPESVDWRKSGAVTPVKNQDTCGTYLTA